MKVTPTPLAVIMHFRYAPSGARRDFATSAAYRKCMITAWEWWRR